MRKADQSKFCAKNAKDADDRQVIGIGHTTYPDVNESCNPPTTGHNEGASSHYVYTEPFTTTYTSSDIPNLLTKANILGLARELYERDDLDPDWDGVDRECQHRYIGEATLILIRIGGGDV